MHPWRKICIVRTNLGERPERGAAMFAPVEAAFDHSVGHGHGGRGAEDRLRDDHVGSQGLQLGHERDQGLASAFYVAFECE